MWMSFFDHSCMHGFLVKNAIRTPHASTDKFIAEVAVLLDKLSELEEGRKVVVGRSGSHFTIAAPAKKRRAAAKKKPMRVAAKKKPARTAAQKKALRRKTA